MAEMMESPDVQGKAAGPTPPSVPAHRTDVIRQWAALLIPAVLIVSLDQISKAWVLANLSLGQTIAPIPALEPFFAVTLSYNTGAAFSLLPQAGDIFLIIALVMTVGIVLFYRRVPPGHWGMRIALGLVLGGTLGNALDRLEFGHVVDWVLLRLPGVVSNASNFADHAIVLGIGYLLITTWRKPPPENLTP
jgi:signal peptidase II